MDSYIVKEIQNGWTEYLSENEGLGRRIQMGVRILQMQAGEYVELHDKNRETAVLVIEGNGEWKADGIRAEFARADQFSCGCECLHAGPDSRIEIIATSQCIMYVQQTENANAFAPVFYTAEAVREVFAGDNGELGGTMRRCIRTIFNYDNAPYSNMVLGEVVNSPGLWSSYPPHHHPQPEVYFYRFDKKQGFGAGFANGQVYRTGQNGLLVIENGFHSQVTAPGYSMCYVWGIRHLEGDPWLNTRIDDEEHAWLLDEGNRAGLYSFSK